ncbi:response regulator receiver protein [Flammeovirgaceae bacterium 311]|nr:response regulator receiver protein [Flammeovirgaceae bacterium 311]
MKQDVKILLVEDYSYDADLTRRALKVNNLDECLLHLSDGKEALDFLLARGKYQHRQNFSNPEVVLLDLDLPKVHGTKVLKQLRSEERTRHIPVVILTVSADDPLIQECYTLGANSFIIKPVDSVKFHQAVNEIGTYWLNYNKNFPTGTSNPQSAP